MQIKCLNDLRSGEGGKISRINGGRGMVGRLAALNIRPGSRITKLNDGFMRGPVTIELDRTQIAIGFGMAARIMVAVEESGQ
ncbi:MAG: ferrous iron transport protein A [Syntrophales bacterium]|jgi:ferrous iron transport protein A|nr:ferrous iron transport protein A [Syntrophales bacterium]MDD4340260.1 FeoA family protein [Syntrophales bacterium]HOG07371.1 FeoA family protein [Syntrophales bacterium]HOS76855.1 FeoA family protein [Syntrophales bacterium]